MNHVPSNQNAALSKSASTCAKPTCFGASHVLKHGLRGLRSTAQLLWPAFMCLVGVLVAGCRGKAAAADLPEIVERGELVAITANSSTSYFDYRGEPMGFQYELANQFAKSLGVSLKLKVVSNPADMVDSLLSGAADLIAYSLPVTNAWKDKVVYCGEEEITHQVLVQRRGEGCLTDVTGLLGKDVYVVPGKYAERMENLNAELGGGICLHVIDADTVSAEDLIIRVALGEIDYTVAANDLAKINRTYYRNLDISLKVSLDQRASWAVNPASPLLAEAADRWHREVVNSPEFQASARRYFEMDKLAARNDILSIKDGRISLYDELFRKYSKEIGWDWRLLASLAYAESNFDPTVVSWAGAKGLMQLMPVTAHAMGVPKGKEQDPEESVRASVKFIAKLQEMFASVPDEKERQKFVLAAYNSGVGHITDAMALASKYGRNRNIWKGNVAHFVLMKSKEEYYSDPVCKHGYFRGSVTCGFVDEVIGRAQMYMDRIKE